MNAILTLSILLLLLSVSACSQKVVSGPPEAVSSEVRETDTSFEKQWATLQRLGFNLNSNVDGSEIELLRKDPSIEKEPYRMLYMYLGRETTKKPWIPLTDRVWDFDTEAIEDHGAFVSILKNLQRISRGELKFENVRDYVDIEEGKAWVSFSTRGKAYKWNLKVEDDWVDTQFFSKIVGLTRTLNTKGRFTYFDTGGQNFVVGYETPEGRDTLIRSTGLKIEWMD